MAMSDCEKCWETPCCCGYDYKNHPRYGPTEGMANYIVGILGYRTKEELEIILQLLNEKILNKIVQFDKNEQTRRKQKTVKTKKFWQPF